MVIQMICWWNQLWFGCCLPKGQRNWRVLVRGQRSQNEVVEVAVDVSQAVNSLCEREIDGPDQLG